MSDNLLKFADEFPSASHAEWLALVEKTLAGKPYDKVMRTKTYDGIEINALEDTLSLALSHQPTRAPGEWSIVSPNWLSDASAVNADILEDLERGASGIAITIDGDGYRGIPASNLKVALDGVYLDMVPFMLIQSGDFEDSIAALKNILIEREYDKAQVSGCLGIDPIGTLVRGISFPVSFEASLQTATHFAQDWAGNYSNVATFVADGTVYSNAGASEALELAAALSCAVHYIRALEQNGMPVEKAAKQIQFTLSAGTDLWLNIAKFRALRRCWQHILHACGVSNTIVKVNAVSALHQVTMKDPWVNILRGTAACFGAGLGGADSVTVLPHDILLGTTDKFSRRIARNIQIILLEESNLAKVADPSAGSYSLEAITADMTAAALHEFQAIEEKGGIVSEINTGAITNRIAETLARRQKDIRNRKRAITGVSEFPNIAEEPIAGITKDTLNQHISDKDVKSLSLNRVAAEFEYLRFKSDDIALKSTIRPRIFLANIGTPAEFTPRATFAKNFFESGGIEAVFGTGKTNGGDFAKDYTATGASLAILCGTDAQYNELGLDIISHLKAAGCKRIYIAGKLNEPAAYEKAGLGEMIYMGCDVITAIQNAYAGLDKHAENGEIS